MGEDFKLAHAIEEGKIADGMKKTYSRKTEQYEGFPPKLNDDFIIWNGYPACRYHGHLSCYAWDVWRCVECGWAVTLKVYIGDTL